MIMFFFIEIFNKEMEASTVISSSSGVVSSPVYFSLKQTSIKVAVIGDHQVGKTSYIYTICKGNNEVFYLTNYGIYNIIFEECLCKADAYFVFFDLTNGQSLETAKEIIKNIKGIIILCGNKYDSQNKVIRPIDFVLDLYKYCLKYYNISITQKYHCFKPIICLLRYITGKRDIHIIG